MSVTPTEAQELANMIHEKRKCDRAQLTYDDLVDGEYYWVVGFKKSRDIVMEFEDPCLRSIRRSYSRNSINALLESGIEIHLITKPKGT